MAKEEVSAKLADGEPVKVQFDFGEPGAMAAKFGGEVVESFAKSGIRVAVQDVIRGGIKAGKKPAEIQKLVDDYKPGVRKKGKSKAEKLQDSFKELTPEERKALLARLTA